MDLIEARDKALALLRARQEVKNSELLALLDHDARWVEAVREELIFHHQAQDKNGVGLRYIGEAPPGSLATPRFLEALGYAVRLHGADLRKGSSVPYVAHLLGVCALVLIDGGREDEAIAALLHDALEDHPGQVSRELLSDRFGSVVAALVAACTDTPPEYQGGQKPPWRQRKTAYLEHLRGATAAELRVALADKVDNVRSILSDYRQEGDKLWARFNAGKEDQLWFYRSLREAFRAVGASGFLFAEFDRGVDELERIVAGESPL